MRCLIIAAATLLLGACATGSPMHGDRDQDGVRSEAAEIAAAMEGRPYRYGGTSPAGFDCSGLVQYAYRQAGVRVPRTTRDQYRAVHPRYVSQLQPGDVIFFRLKSARPSHVGIYLGDGEFVHALRPGRPVQIDRVDDDYWQRHIVRAGSFRL